MRYFRALASPVSRKRQVASVVGRASVRRALIGPNFSSGLKPAAGLWLFVGHASACQPAFEPAFSMLGEFLGLGTTTLAVHEAGETLHTQILPMPRTRCGSLARLDKLKHVLPRRRTEMRHPILTGGQLSAGLPVFETRSSGSASRSLRDMKSANIRANCVSGRFTSDGSLKCRPQARLPAPLTLSLKSARLTIG